MKGNILDNLYFGTLSPYDNQITDIAEYKNLLKLSGALFLKLDSLLNDNQKDILEKLLSANSEISELAKHDKFKQGFVLRTRISSESHYINLNQLEN